MNINNIEIGSEYIMTTAYKADSTSSYQPKTVVKDNIAYQTTHIRVKSVKDSGEYFYIGYVPAGDDTRRFGFGYTKVYKKGEKPYGVISFEPVTT